MFHPADFKARARDLSAAAALLPDPLLGDVVAGRVSKGFPLGLLGAVAPGCSAGLDSAEGFRGEAVVRTCDLGGNAVLTFVDGRLESWNGIEPEPVAAVPDANATATAAGAAVATPATPSPPQSTATAATTAGGVECDDAALQLLTKGQLRIRRNEVYARHGRVFTSEDLGGYFRAQPWYSPDPGYTDDRLTPEDKACVARISALERG